ncbi:MAG: type II toxin-antitoxin system VapC family toxin [Candidatus Marinimicrobia bacterium]|nr:type II toxin-antitoxin system VapC family toxin [Candidatus Neomarinimicrobiota bacterium]
MSLVIDTNILFYYIAKVEPFFKHSHAILEAEVEFVAPDIWRPEFLNALWVASRLGAMDENELINYLPLAANIIDRTVPADRIWTDALQLAVKTGHPPYDTLFVALAQKEKTLLVTFDKKILELFPGIAKRPDEILRK